MLPYFDAVLLPRSLTRENGGMNLDDFELALRKQVGIDREETELLEDKESKIHASQLEMRV
jgi:hypothetical protein